MERLELVETRHGLMMAAPNDKFIGEQLIRYGEYIEAEFRVLDLLVPKGGVVVEAGANIGALTVPLARKADVVIAFEPQRLVYQQLCGNIALNRLRNVYCLYNAVGGQAGRVMVPQLDTTKEANFGALSLLDGERYKADHEFLPVDMMTVDQLGLSQLDLLKVDVEGMELDVLDGAKETIKRLKPKLSVENDRPEISGKIAEWMAGNGYLVLQHFPPLFNPNNFRGEKENIYGKTVAANLIGLPAAGGLPEWVTNDVIGHGLQPVAGPK